MSPNKQKNFNWEAILLGKFHRRYIHTRRVDVLARHFAQIIPKNARVLDVGSGDGLLASIILNLRSDLQLEAIDTLVRPQTLVPTSNYDGQHFPFADQSFDIVMLVDVLHHVDNVSQVLQEANRVSKSHILIKDHFVQGLLARPTLLFMDNVGNRQYGVAIPANYLSKDQWKAEYDKLGLEIEQRIDKVGLYPAPLSWFFERQLHFIDLIRIRR